MTATAVATTHAAHPWLPALPRLTTPQTPPPMRRARRASWRWEGVIVGRMLPADLPEREYQVLCAGGARRWREADHLADGRVIARVDAFTQRAIARDLDRLALAGYEIVVAHNVACNAGRTQLLNALANSGTTDGVVYFTVGTGAGTPNATDTRLFTELFRKAWSGSTISGNQNLFNTLFTTADTGAIGTYTECGLFGGSTATTSPNTGSLYAHSPYPYVFAAGQQLSNSYTVSLN